MKVISKLFLLIFILLNASSAAANEDETDLKIGIGIGKYPPFEYMDGDKLTGFHIDLLRSVCDTTRYKCSFNLLPWKRAVEYLEEGRIHALTYMQRNSKRDKFAIFLKDNILSIAQYNLIHLSDSPTNYTGNLEELRGKLVAVQSGFYYGETFKNDDLIEKLELRDPKQIFQTVLHKRVDFGIIDTLPFINKFSNLPDFSLIKISPFPIRFSQFYIAFSRQSGETQAIEFNNAMGEFKKTSAYYGLMNRYKIGKEQVLLSK